MTLTEVQYKKGCNEKMKISYLCRLQTAEDDEWIQRAMLIGKTSEKTVGLFEVKEKVAKTIKVDQIGLNFVVMADGCLCYKFYEREHDFDKFELSSISQVRLDSKGLIKKD